MVLSSVVSATPEQSIDHNRVSLCSTGESVDCDENDDLIIISNAELNQMGLNEKWRFNAELEIFVRSIPKIELHVHFGEFHYT